MAGVVLETLSNKKLSILSISLILIFVAFFLIGGLIAPAPNNVIHSITVKCIDKNNDWHFQTAKPMIPRGGKACLSVETFDDQYIQTHNIDSNQIVFAQQIPLPREGKELDMSRWFQHLISVLDVGIEYDEDYPHPEDEKPEMMINASLYYRDKEDDEHDWKLLAASSERRFLDCTIEKRNPGNLYSCDLLPFFELGSVHYDYYLINIALPVSVTSTVNRIGKLYQLDFITIFQNGGFTQVWFSMKTVLFPSVVAVLVWFWRRVMTQGRSTNLTERTLFSLGIILSIMNCPIEWLTLVVNMPFMMLLNDIRDGAFYAMLLSFWIIFVGEHMMDQMERNTLTAYWKQLTVIILACLSLFVFEMCERGTQLVNPFNSIWSSEIGGVAAFGFIIVAAIAACLYFIFLCYLVFKVFRNISSKRSYLLNMSTFRRKYYTGLIFRFKFLMIITLLCAALTVISFIIGQFSEGQWKWEDSDVSLEYTSAFLTGVYGMWNVYVIALLSLYAPSHKKFSLDTDDTDTNSREEEVQLTHVPSESSNLQAYVTKISAE